MVVFFIRKLDGAGTEKAVEFPWTISYNLTYEKPKNG